MEKLLPQARLRQEYHDVVNMDRVRDMVLEVGESNELVKAIMKDTGFFNREARKMAVCMENMLHEVSLERTVEIYRMLGNMGVGRGIVGIFKKIYKN